MEDTDAYESCGDIQNDNSRLPIAVVGIGCRFPGNASSPDKFWELISQGRSALSTMPKDRLNVDAFYHPQPERHGTVSCELGLCCAI